MIDLDTLEMYAHLEGTEFGEHCMNIVNCFSRLDCMSDSFIDALNIEAARLLKEFKDNYTIEEVEMSHTYTDRYLELK